MRRTSSILLAWLLSCAAVSAQEKPPAPPPAPISADSPKPAAPPPAAAQAPISADAVRPEKPTSPAPARISADAVHLDRPVPLWLEESWAQYKSRFVIGGRVIDNVNRITHSEGQGYAMLIAVRASDRAAFQEIWAWTKRELFVRRDGLASWKWDERAKPNITDTNNATDGDILIAWALVEAGERWQSAEYVDAARAIVSAVGRKTLARSPFGLIMMPAVDGFAEGQQPDGPVINLSYWVFPAFERLKGLSPEIDWADLQSTGLRLIRNSRFGPIRLPADWVGLGSGGAQPARNFPTRFSYNAIRIPLYLAWAGHGGPSNLRPFAGLWNESLNIGPFEIDLPSGSALQTFTGAGYRSVAAIVSCALEQRKLPASLRGVPMEDYYPTTLHILSLIAMQERYPQCL